MSTKTQIDLVRLQKMIDAAEKGGGFSDLESLSYYISGTNWAQMQGLEADAIASLVKKHKLWRKTPDVHQPPQPPEPVAPVKVSPKKETPQKPAGPQPKYAPAAAPDRQPVVEPAAPPRQTARPEPAPQAVTPRRAATFHEEESKASMAAKRYGCDSILYTPAGKPPVPLTETDRQSVEDWAEAVRVKRQAIDRRFVSLGALVHYVKMSVFYGDKAKARVVTAHLHDIYPDE